MHKIKHKVAIGERNNPVIAVLAFLQADSAPVDVESFLTTADLFVENQTCYFVRDYKECIELAEETGFDIGMRAGVFVAKSVLVGGLNSETN